MNTKIQTNFEDMFDHNIITPGGLASEVELIRFFTMFPKLKLARMSTAEEALNKLIERLQRRQ